jgi:hypothetical protein
MAYKFQRGTAVASGSFTAEQGFTATSGGVTVTAGNIVAAASQLTASAVSASTAQFGTISVASFSPTNLDISGYIDVKGATRLSGTVALGDADADIITVNGQITGSYFKINGGAIDATTVGKTTQASGQFTTLSASSTLQAGTNATIGGNLTVNGASASTFANRVNIAEDGSAISVSGSGQLVIGGIKNYDQQLISINQKIVVRDAGDTTDKAFFDGSGQVSGSGALNIGGTATIATGLTVTAGGLTVTAGDSSVQKLTVNGDLVVLGTTFSASVGSLLIEDKAIVVGDGSTAFGTNYGLLFGSGSNEWASLQTGQGLGGTENVLSSSLTLKANSTITNVANPVYARGDADVTLAVGINYGNATVTLPRTWTLPSTSTILTGQSVKVKAADGVSTTNTITISGTDQTIDGETFITLESPYAAVELVYVATNTWRVF